MRASIVGDVMGKYHPHGNLAIYDALVRMAQDFSMSLPLIDGQGNFGSMDGDPPAADDALYRGAPGEGGGGDPRRISTRTRSISAPTTTRRMMEPVVLPSRIPNLLVNGAGGIAVGMATNIPPHNLSEVVDACLRVCCQSGHDDRGIDARTFPGRISRRARRSWAASGIHSAPISTGNGSVHHAGDHVVRGNP